MIDEVSADRRVFWNRDGMAHFWVSDECVDVYVDIFAAEHVFRDCSDVVGDEYGGFFRRTTFAALKPSAVLAMQRNPDPMISDRGRL